MKDSCEAISYPYCFLNCTCYSNKKFIHPEFTREWNWSSWECLINTISELFLSDFKSSSSLNTLGVCSYTFRPLGKFSNAVGKEMLPGTATAKCQLLTFLSVQGSRPQPWSFQQHYWFINRTDKHRLGGNEVIWGCFFTSEWKWCLIIFIVRMEWYMLPGWWKSPRCSEVSQPTHGEAWVSAVVSPIVPKQTADVSSKLLCSKAGHMLAPVLP